MIINIIIALAIIFRTLGMIFAFVFVVRYSRFNWKALPEGRHLITFSAIVALFLLYATVNSIAAWVDPDTPPKHIDGDYPGRVFIALVLFVFVAFSMWQRNHLLTKAQKETKESP